MPYIIDYVFDIWIDVGRNSGGCRPPSGKTPLWRREQQSGGFGMVAKNAMSYSLQ